jgi:hypothetical protein
MDIGTTRGEMTTSPRTEVSTREASDPPDEPLISATGWWKAGIGNDQTHHFRSCTNTRISPIEFYGISIRSNAVGPGAQTSRRAGLA